MSFEIAKQHFLDGLGFFQADQFEKAEFHFLESLKIMPDRVSTLTNLSATQIKLSKLSEAKDLLQKTIILDKNNTEAFLNLGLIDTAQLNFKSALIYFEQAITLNPKSYQAWSNKGLALTKLKNYDAALIAYERGINLHAKYPEVWLNKGITLAALNRHEEAFLAYEMALNLKPDYYEGLLNKVLTLQSLKRYDATLDVYEKAMKLKPDSDYLLGYYLYIKILIGDWNQLESEVEQLIKKINMKLKVAFPFSTLPLVDSPEIHLAAAKIFVKDKYSIDNSLDNIPHILNKKIRIGYFSADFHNHATSYLMAEFFELHNKDHFEIIAFSFGPSFDDESRQRLMNTFDEFLDVDMLSDKEIANLSREKRIDIAIDLKGFTKDHRTGIFAYRAAPLQVNYLGYPGTMGADFIDYIIADPTLIPQESQSFYSEKIIYLPNTYQVNDSKRKMANIQFSRADLGLPQKGFIFCCFNNNYKITANNLDSFARILKNVPGSILWLFEDNPTVKENLIKEASNRAISKDQLVFARKMPIAEHLSRLRVADLFLDTLPYNAHTTASDALWAGLPLLTLIGKSFQARVAASLLMAIRLPELITYSQDEFESLAIELANNSEKLLHIKEKLHNNRSSTPVFNTQLLTQHIETAYTKIYERYLANLSPEHIYIDQ